MRLKRLNYRTCARGSCGCFGQPFAGNKAQTGINENEIMRVPVWQLPKVNLVAE